MTPRRLPAAPLALLAFALLAAPAVATSVVQAGGSLYVEGVTPVGVLGCYSRALVELVRDKDAFFLRVEYAPGTDLANRACATVSQRSGSWASPSTSADDGAEVDADGDGRDDAAFASFTIDGSKITVAGDRWEGEVRAKASTTLEPGSGTYRVTQKFWYPGFEDAPYHTASGILSKTDVYQAKQWGAEYAAFGSQAAGGGWG